MWGGYEITDVGVVDERRGFSAERRGVFPDFAVEFSGKRTGVVAAVCRSAARMKARSCDIFGDVGPFDTSRGLAFMAVDGAAVEYACDVLAQV